jgi:hypothetical protein
LPPPLDELGGCVRLEDEVLGRVELTLDEDLLVGGEGELCPALLVTVISLFLLVEIFEHGI